MALGGKSLTWFEGNWHEGNHPIIAATDHGAWLASGVFDGARWFDGLTPDLDLHCQRLVRSAESFGMVPNITAEELLKICLEGIERFKPGDTALYIRPMMWSRDGTESLVELEPNSTACCVCIEEFPMLLVTDYSLTVAPYRRPRQDMALTEAKSGSLYPNNGRIFTWAKQQGFSNALSLDIDDNVAETASTNVFAVRGDVVSTPVPNGCFLNGLTRQRVIGLLKDDGIEVEEKSMTVGDFESADEIFITGNMHKVTPVDRFQDRELGNGKLSMKARSLYLDWAKEHAAAK